MSDVEFETLVEPFCDNYCRYPRICRDQDKLEEKCEECPICKIVELFKENKTELSQGNVEHCVSCGEVIPEGSWYCGNCETSQELSCREKILRTFLGGR